MARQNLRERAGVIAINELHGKVSTEQGREHLRSLGLLPPPEELIKKGEDEYTRDIFQASGRYKCEDVQGGFLWGNFTEEHPDGTSDHYYKKIRETTVDEAVQLLEYWHTGELKCQARIRELAKILIPIHGRRKLQKLLSFDLPARELVMA